MEEVDVHPQGECFSVAEYDALEERLAVVEGERNALTRLLAQNHGIAAEKLTKVKELLAVAMKLNKDYEQQLYDREASKTWKEGA